MVGVIPIVGPLRQQCLGKWLTVSSSGLVMVVDSVDDFVLCTVEPLSPSLGWWYGLAGLDP